MRFHVDLITNSTDTSDRVPFFNFNFIFFFSFYNAKIHTEKKRFVKCHVQWLLVFFSHFFFILIKFSHQS